MGMPVEPGINENWEQLLKLRSTVLASLETARNNKIIGGSLEATIVLTGPAPDGLMARYGSSLPALFIVSQVDAQFDGPDPLQLPSFGLDLSAVKVRVERAAGAKCERCWNYSTHVGESADYPTVCERCVAALAEIERATPAGAGS
jgi:isoleucyl-tRNA synthetase